MLAVMAEGDSEIAKYSAHTAVKSRNKEAFLLP